MFLNPVKRPRRCHLRRGTIGGSVAWKLVREAGEALPTGSANRPRSLAGHHKLNRGCARQATAHAGYGQRVGTGRRS